VLVLQLPHKCRLRESDIEIEDNVVAIANEDLMLKFFDHDNASPAGPLRCQYVPGHSSLNNSVTYSGRDFYFQRAFFLQPAFAGTCQTLSLMIVPAPLHVGHGPTLTN